LPPPICSRTRSPASEFFQLLVVSMPGPHLQMSAAHRTDLYLDGTVHNHSFLTQKSAKLDALQGDKNHSSSWHL
jgi:hypothetical protein